MKSIQGNSGLLRLLLVTCMVLLAACGSDDDSDTNIVVNPDGTERQEEEGPVDSEPAVIVNNNVIQNVTVINRRTRIENNDYVMDWECGNVDPVVHKQYVYISVSCPTVIEHDRNRDGVLDQVEIQEAMGPAVLALDSNIQSPEEETFPEGQTYQYQQSMPLNELRRVIPPGQDFAVVVYGVDESRALPTTVRSTSPGPVHLNIPIACKIYKAPPVSDGPQDETTTTTGENGGETTGTTGGDTGADATTTTTTGGVNG